MQMPPTLSAPHPIFVLPRESSHAHLKWARRLAQAEGIVLLIGSFIMIARGNVLHPSVVALGAVGLSIISLTLGWQVGRGSVLAAAILLGLSISRWVMTFIPGAPGWWTTFPPLTLVELYVFAQGLRGAIALSRDISTTVKAPLVNDAGITELRDGLSATRTAIAERSPFVDGVIAVGVAALSLAWLTAPIPHGLAGFDAGLRALLGFLNIGLLAVMLFGAFHARRGKGWGRRLHTGVYYAFLIETLFSLAFLLG